MLVSLKQIFFDKATLIKRAAFVIRKDGFQDFWSQTKEYLKGSQFISSKFKRKTSYRKWIERTKLTGGQIDHIKSKITELNYRPKISILMPVYNVEKLWLDKAIDSVINQLYDNWELCIVDDASTKKHVKETIDKYTHANNRIQSKYLAKNRGISGASNEALKMATGEFVGILDHDDEIAIDALYENVRLLNKHQNADLIYSDEDKIDYKGKRKHPFFKPDYSPDLLLSVNYICHFILIRRSIIEDLGGFRSEYDGAQDYDLILRVIEKTDPEKIFHIPKILYHWRKIPGSEAGRAGAKDGAFISAKQALSDYLKRNEVNGDVLDGRYPGTHRIKRKLYKAHKVSIIIPFRDHPGALKKCIDSILSKTSYKNYDIILVNNQSVEKETFEYLDGIKPNKIFKILAYDKLFNYSAVHNHTVSHLNSEYLIFLNNDTEVISPDWIESLLEIGQRKEVGAVGALLYYPNDTIQHAGIILGIGGVAGHSHKHFMKGSKGYFGRIKIIQNLSAVTAACMLTKKSIFRRVDGFDENLSHAFNDVDYCLKIRSAGYQVVYTPYAELYHHESLSRGYEDSPEKRERFNIEIRYFQKKWNSILKAGDPYYNPNLTLERHDFSIGTHPPP